MESLEDLVSTGGAAGCSGGSYGIWAPPVLVFPLLTSIQMQPHQHPEISRRPMEACGDSCQLWALASSGAVGQVKVVRNGGGSAEIFQSNSLSSGKCSGFWVTCSPQSSLCDALTLPALLSSPQSFSLTSITLRSRHIQLEATITFGFWGLKSLIMLYFCSFRFFAAPCCTSCPSSGG